MYIYIYSTPPGNISKRAAHHLEMKYYAIR